ncbi:hypothetical protein [Actinocorallia aurantiaca]|uniref:Uncharacterized protein n=1 Tax=Actinocorallia aurantiaca TaxID=46204 RepID=A0ABP6GIP4_9ACTN
MGRKRCSGPRRDGGASAVEYGAVLILVAALAAVFTVVALPERVKTSTAAAICQLFSGTDARDCPEEQPPAAVDGPDAEDDPALPDPTTEGRPPDTDPADPALDPDDPDVQAYNDAKQEAGDADQALDDLGDESEDVKQEILDLLKDVVGITDIEDCLSKGDIVACISALAGLVPWGKVLKVLKKIPGAVKLAKRLKELWDKVSDAKARKKKADDALDAAENKLKDKGICPVSAPNSLLPGLRAPTLTVVRVHDRTPAGPHFQRLVAVGTPVLVPVSADDRFKHLNRPGYRNYVLVDKNGKVYYTGMFGPNDTPAGVQNRHGNNHNRFDPSNGDTMRVTPGTRTYGESRLMEQRLAEQHGTIIGRDGDNYRGNRQNPLDPAKLSEYEAYEQRIKGGCP